MILSSKKGVETPHWQRQLPHLFSHVLDIQTGKTFPSPLMKNSQSTKTYFGLLQISLIKSGFSSIEPKSQFCSGYFGAGAPQSYFVLFTPLNHTKIAPKLKYVAV
jgi:hypothetical protein